MHCILNGHDYVYDIQTITQIFYPNERFTRVKEAQTQGLTAFSALTSTECQGALYLDGCIMQKSVMPLPEVNRGSEKQITRTPVTDNITGTQEIRRRLMITLYLALQAYTGQTPPWGALTGIRPSKMARLLLEKGYTKDSVIDAMKKNYLTRRDKIALAVDVAAAENDILGTQPPNAFSLYVGIPFCPSRCLYCSFASYPIGHDQSLMDLYLDALEKELLAIRNLEQGNDVSAVYIGGGTPTVLSEKQLDRLLSFIMRHFGDHQEFTVEAGRPDTIDAHKLRVLTQYGVNRISLNPQSMHDDTLALIGRNHTVNDFYRSFDMAREEGVDNINTDIILGLPGETPAHISETMDRLLALKPENVTVHILTIKRASLLRETLERYPLAGVGELEDMLDISQRKCKESGMQPYYMYRQKNMLGNFENVGYCVTGRQSKYNVLIMEETQSIWAAGAGAVTKLVFGDRIERVFNVKSLNDYITRIDEMIKRKEENYADTDPSRY